MSSAEFMRVRDRLAAAWLSLVERDPSGAEALLRRALVEGVSGLGDLPEPAAPVPEQRRRRFEVALVRLSGAVDEAGYLEHNPDVAERGGDPVSHFVRRGWWKVRNPSRDFDVWWYTAQHLDPCDPAEDDLNPLVHYLLDGRFRGLSPLPERPAPRSPTSFPEGHDVRRICLFAGYDVDGIVDDYVVAYLRELSRFADVYYLADCRMRDGEMEKLDGVVAGAWAIRHGRYDFGSYSMLARDLVGWDVIDGYDELLLVNDSCYLLRPLDDVFARMEAQPCDWWGLQVTARNFDGLSPGPRTVPLAEVKRSMLPRSVLSYDEFVHVGSYFLGLRGPVIRDEGFRKRLNEVAKQRSKINLIYKYEHGTTQYLIGQGFDFSTFIPDLHPYHPIYGPGAFELVAQGFPLLKRQFISENPYDAPDLRQWKERLAPLVPHAPFETMEDNLLRVSAGDRLGRSLGIVTRPDGSVHVPEQLTDEEVDELDRATPTYDHWWAFPVCAYDHSFAGNERALFEEVRRDPTIKKVILTRSRRVELAGENVEIVPLLSREGQELAVRCGQVFVKHAPSINVPYLRDTERRNFINTWHGIPLKRFGFASADTSEHRESVIEEHSGCRAVITSSTTDSLAMAAAFHPLPHQNMWVTGLPRNDMILRPEADLPSDLAADERMLRDEVGDRRLVMLLPTFKKDQDDAYYRFTAEQVEWLRAWSERHRAVIGLREHMADTERVYSQMLAPLEPIDISSRRYPHLEVLYRVADALVTDYSSCLVDFMLTGRPVVSFAYDLDRYAMHERGLFYDLGQVIPGPVCRTFDDLAPALDDLFRPRTAEELDTYAWQRRIFFQYIDDQSSRRVVDRVRRLYVDPEPAS